MADKIMIVDDMMINVEMLTSILSPQYSIMSATSGESALQQIGQVKPDLVLLDVSMPGIDGFEVLRLMKENPSFADIPVIFVTGEHDELSEEKGLELGAVDYIKKPYNSSVVSVKVRNHLELKSYRDTLQFMVDERTKELRALSERLAASHEAIIMGMSLMADLHDNVTGDHIKRIKVFTKIIADAMLERYPEIITEDQADQIVLYSTLHDVGKVSIPDSILKKQGSFTNEEFDIMKSHTLRGADLLQDTESFLAADHDSDELSTAIEIARSHHEKYDGTGYPSGLAGDEIPLSARIVSIADVYDALRSSRPYKKGYSHEESLDIILNGDGRTIPKHFDPRVLELFRDNHESFDHCFVTMSDQ